MAAPTPLAGGIGGKVTQFFSAQGRWGWTESYYVYVNGGTNWFQDVEAGVTALNVNRLASMPTTYSIDATRIEQLFQDSGHQSLLIPAPKDGMGPGSVSGATAGPWAAWLFHERDASGIVNGSRLYRGWAAADWDGYQAGSATLLSGLPKKVQSLQTAMNGFLGSRIVGPSGGTLTWALLGYDRRQGVGQSPVMPISAVTLDAANHLQFSVNPTLDALIVQGSMIKVSVRRQRCIKGISGMWRVVSTPTTVGTVTTYATGKTFCCPGVNLATITGELRRYVPAFFAYPVFNPNNSDTFAIAASRAVNKKTGRAFFSTRGRQQSRCC